MVFVAAEGRTAAVAEDKTVAVAAAVGDSSIAVVVVVVVPLAVVHFCQDPIALQLGLGILKRINLIIMIIWSKWPELGNGSRGIGI